MSPDEPPTKRRSTATRTTAEESKHTADDVIETIIRGVGLVTVDITDDQCSQTDLRSISTRTKPSPSYRDSPRRCAHRGRDEQGPKRMMRCAQPVSRSRWKRGLTEAKMEAGTDRSKCLFVAALNRHQGRDGSGDRPNRATGIEVAMEAGTDRSEDGSGDRPKRVPLRRCAQPASRSRWKRDRSTGIEVAMDRPNRVPLRCCAQPASRLRWKRGSERMMRCDDGRRSLLRRCQSQRFSNLNLSFFHFIPHFYLQLRTKQFAYQEAEAKNPEMMTPSKKRNWEDSRAEWVNNINNDPWLTVLGGKKPCKRTKIIRDKLRGILVLKYIIVASLIIINCLASCATLKYLSRPTHQERK